MPCFVMKVAEARKYVCIEISHLFHSLMHGLDNLI